MPPIIVYENLLPAVIDVLNDSLNLSPKLIREKVPLDMIHDPGHLPQQQAGLPHFDSR